MSEILKPCPFCKSTPHHGLTKVRYCQLHGDPYQDYQVWCPRGGVQYEGSHARVQAADKDRTFEAWNQRTTPSEPSAPPAWIACKDRMPALDQRVLVWTGNAKSPCMFTAQRHEYRNGHPWQWTIDTEEDAERGDKWMLTKASISHWMPLPAPPSQGEKP